MNGGGAGASSLEDDEEFEARKHEWQVLVQYSLCPVHYTTTFYLSPIINRNNVSSVSPTKTCLIAQHKKVLNSLKFLSKQASRHNL